MKKIALLRNPQSSASQQLGVLLEAEGFCVDHLNQDSSDWISEIHTIAPDTVLLEVAENNYRERYEFCQQLRNETETLPILLLGDNQGNGDGHRKSAHHLLEGLHIGANDYIPSPYELPELITKINTALRVKASLEKASVLAAQINEVNDELYQRNIQVEKELYITRQLQQSLLPPTIAVPEEEGDMGPMFTKIHYEDEKLRISGIYLPCDALGGDLYDVNKLPNNTLGISITDVSGHGVPAAFITTIFKTSLFRVSLGEADPSKVLYAVNNELCDIVKTGDYVTSIYLTVNLDTFALECANGGHPYPFYYRASDQTVTRLTNNGTPLIWVKDMDFPKDTISLNPGDKLFLFTDGVSELKNPNNQMFGEERIEQVLLEAIASGTSYLTDYLIGHLSDFTEGNPLEDDLSMVLIEAL